MSGSSTKRVGAAEFRARCLELVDQVREARAEYIVTRHGRPVAKLGPVTDEEAAPVALVGSMRGTVIRFDRPFDPIPGAWAMDEPEPE